MKLNVLTSLLICCVHIADNSIAALSRKEIVSKHTKFHDDERYWKRYLQKEGASMSTAESPVPLPSPTNTPSNPPITPSDSPVVPPTDSPTPPPTSAPKSCLLEVSLACTDSEGTDCKDIPPRTTDCESEVFYEFKIDNIGDVSMKITELIVKNGEEVDDLTDEVDLVEVGGFVKVTENETIDFCSDGNYASVVTVKAEPPLGDSCEDNEMYEFEVRPPCDLSLELTCSLTEDPTSSCETIGESVSPKCLDCAPTSLCFTYTARSCPPDDSSPPGLESCADIAGGPQEIADIVVSNGRVVFINATYTLGEEFCVTNRGSLLPEEIFVFINAPMGGNAPETNQLMTIDSTCQGEGLSLLQSYGAFDLTRYINCNGDHDCFVPVTIEYSVSNNGQRTVDITDLSATYNDNTEDLTSDVPSEKLRLLKEEKILVLKDYVAERCEEKGIKVSATVTAKGDDGSVCEDKASISIDVPIEVPKPSSPSPTQLSSLPSSSPSDTPSMPSPVPPKPVLEPSDSCFAQVSVECIPPINPEDPDGARFEDCDSINIVPAECTEFVTVLTFRYNGGDCLQSNNIQDPRVYQCEDFMGGPPTTDELGAESYLLITDIKGEGINYYNGPVFVGDVFNITNISPNPVIVANVNATFYDGEPSPENMRQTMVIHTSCSQVTFLKDRYGALELVGFGNPSQGYLTCNTPVSFKFIIENTASAFNAVLQTLTSITNFDSPNDILNYTSEIAGRDLGPGSELPVSSEPITIDLSVRKRYTVFTTVQGVSPEGFSCRGSDFTNFTAGQPDSRPTFAPVSRSV